MNNPNPASRIKTPYGEALIAAAESDTSLDELSFSKGWQAALATKAAPKADEEIYYKVLGIFGREYSRITGAVDGLAMREAVDAIRPYLQPDATGAATKREYSEELNIEIRLYSSMAGDLKDTVSVIPVATVLWLIDKHLVPLRETDGSTIGIRELIKDAFFEGFGIGDTQASEKTIEGFWQHSQAKDNIPPLLQGNDIEGDSPAALAKPDATVSEETDEAIEALRWVFDALYCTHNLKQSGPSIQDILDHIGPIIGNDFVKRHTNLVINSIEADSPAALTAKGEE